MSFIVSNIKLLLINGEEMIKISSMKDQKERVYCDAEVRKTFVM